MTPALLIATATDRFRNASAETVGVLAPHASVRHRRRSRSSSDLLELDSLPAKAQRNTCTSNSPNIAAGNITRNRNDSMPIAVTARGAV